MIRSSVDSESLTLKPDLPELLVLADKLVSCLHRDDWAGPDPYDALLSPLGRHLPNKQLRQVLTQAVKRSPVNLRGVLRIRSVRTAAATGLGATACARLGGDPAWRQRAKWLGARTAEAQMTVGYPGLWGYEFDVQTRWAFYPRSEPNIVATTFAADGCLAAGALDSRRVEALGHALLDHLYLAPHFSYTPLSRVLIHNANLMAASLALRVSARSAMPADLAASLRTAGLTATDATIACQRPDGSWPYGEGPRLGWVDGFHTGYVLLRLDEAVSHGSSEWAEALYRGAEFYFSNLFDGARPRYSTDDPARRDGNNAATALRMAAWGARRGFVESEFPERVYHEISRQGWWDTMLTPRSHWSRRQLPSARWLGAPLLDALTAWIDYLR